MPEISIIIPTYQEAENIEATFGAINPGRISSEVIVVDGGSTDETVARAEQAGADRVFASEKSGRSRQMNAGAREARGEWLLFLHADTFLPDGGLEAITALPRSIVGGGFQRRFDSKSKVLATTAFFSDFRSRWSGIFLGDQAVFVRRSVFEAIGGYDERFRVAEEIDLCRRLKKEGATTLLAGPAISSARRFENRELRQSLLDIWLTGKIFLKPEAFYFSNESSEMEVSPPN